MHKVSTRFCLMLECFSCSLRSLKLSWRASGLLEHSNIATSGHRYCTLTYIYTRRAQARKLLKFASTLCGGIRKYPIFRDSSEIKRMRKQCVPGVLFLRPSPRMPGYEAINLSTVSIQFYGDQSRMRSRFSTISRKWLCIVCGQGSRPNGKPQKPP